MKNVFVKQFSRMKNYFILSFHGVKTPIFKKGVVMKKFDYVSPEVEVILFDSSDIITTSGPGGKLDPEEDTSAWG